MSPSRNKHCCCFGIYLSYLLHMHTHTKIKTVLPPVFRSIIVEMAWVVTCNMLHVCATCATHVCHIHSSPCIGCLSWTPTEVELWCWFSPWNFLYWQLPCRKKPLILYIKSILKLIVIFSILKSKVELTIISDFSVTCNIEYICKGI